MEVNKKDLVNIAKRMVNAFNPSYGYTVEAGRHSHSLQVALKLGPVWGMLGYGGLRQPPAGELRDTAFLNTCEKFSH